MLGVDAALHRVAELEGGFGGLLRPACNLACNPACNPACNGDGGGSRVGGGCGGRGSGSRDTVGGSRRDGPRAGAAGRSSALSQLQGLSDKLHALNLAPERGREWGAMMQLAVPSSSRISCSAPATRPPPALVRRDVGMGGMLHGPNVHVATAAPGRPQSAGGACLGACHCAAVSSGAVPGGG